jgi:uncharacterized protein (DUF608 family)
MYLPKNIIDLIFSFDSTYKELFNLVIKQIKKKNMKPIWNGSYYVLDYSN